MTRPVYSLECIMSQSCMCCSVQQVTPPRPTPFTPPITVCIITIERGTKRARRQKHPQSSWKRARSKALLHASKRGSLLEVRSQVKLFFRVSTFKVFFDFDEFFYNSFTNSIFRAAAPT